MRVELPRVDAGGFQRLGRALAGYGPGRSGPDPLPGLLLRAGAGGLAAAAMRVEASRALALDGMVLVPPPHPGCLRGLLAVAASCAGAGEGAFWLVRRADGGAEAMGESAFGAFLGEVRETGDEVALAAVDREAAEAAEAAWDRVLPLALAG